METSSSKVGARATVGTRCWWEAGVIEGERMGNGHLPPSSIRKKQTKGLLLFNQRFFFVIKVIDGKVKLLSNQQQHSISIFLRGSSLKTSAKTSACLCVFIHCLNPLRPWIHLIGMQQAFMRQFICYKGGGNGQE